MADFLVALADFDRRRLWIDLGYTSLFHFLHRDLRLSAGAASQRKSAAELLCRVPEAAEPLRDGRLYLSSIIEVARVVTPENQAEVLPRFFGLSAREAREVTAALCPVEQPPRREVVPAVVRARHEKSARVLDVRTPWDWISGGDRGCGSDFEGNVGLDRDADPDPDLAPDPDPRPHSGRPERRTAGPESRGPDLRRASGASRRFSTCARGCRMTGRPCGAGTSGRRTARSTRWPAPSTWRRPSGRWTRAWPGRPSRWRLA
jgi:hypothetical protein